MVMTRRGSETDLQPQQVAVIEPESKNMQIRNARGTWRSQYDFSPLGHWGDMQLTSSMGRTTSQGHTLVTELGCGSQLRSKSSLWCSLGWEYKTPKVLTGLAFGTLICFLPSTMVVILPYFSNCQGHISCLTVAKSYKCPQKGHGSTNKLSLIFGIILQTNVQLNPAGYVSK